MNWDVCERKQSWPVVRYFSGICLEKKEENCKSLRTVGSLAEGLKQKPPKYKSEALSLEHSC
jgi:hypothetical protein